MKKIILIMLLLVSLISFGQNLKTDKYEVYLNDYVTNEVNISRGMYMTNNLQYFHEGKIEVVDIDTNKSQMVMFYFSVWDDKFKELIIKNMKFDSLSPKFDFEDNSTIKYTSKSGEVVTEKLIDISSFEYAILSGALVWLNIGTTEK